jgi:hypothetical protein
MSSLALDDPDPASGTDFGCDRSYCPSTSSSLEAEHFSFELEPFSLDMEPFSLEQEPCSLEQEPLSLDPEPFSFGRNDVGQDDIDRAAWDATVVAGSWITDGRSVTPLLITHAEVDAAVLRLQNEPDSGELNRVGIQDVLHRHLAALAPPTGPISLDYDDYRLGLMLEEAAYHLRTRVDSPDDAEICYFAIASVLAGFRPPIKDLPEQHSIGTRTERGDHARAAVPQGYVSPKRQESFALMLT